MKLIALVSVLSVLTCLDAREVQANSLVGTARCYVGPPAHDDYYICRFTAPIVRLILQPSRTMKLIKEALANLISTFNLKEVMEAFLGAITLPLSTVIHTPELIMMAIEEIEGAIIPELKISLEFIEGALKEDPLGALQVIVTSAIIIPPYAVLQVIEGFFVALAQSGFAHYHETFMFLHRVVMNVFDKIKDSIWRFHCTNIISQSSCTKVYQAFENIVVNPVISFVDGLMALLEKVLEKVKQVVFPIVEKLTPSHLQRYCGMVLAEETCTKIFSYIREMDKFGKVEVMKVRVLVKRVTQWIKEHIFSLTLLYRK